VTSQQPTQFENYPLEPDPGAKVNSDAAYGAQHMIDQLSEDF
jgi:hypothetical protein